MAQFGKKIQFQSSDFISSIVTALTTVKDVSVEKGMKAVAEAVHFMLYFSLAGIKFMRLSIPQDRWRNTYELLLHGEALKCWSATDVIANSFMKKPSLSPCWSGCKCSDKSVLVWYQVRAKRGARPFEAFQCTYQKGSALWAGQTLRPSLVPK